MAPAFGRKLVINSSVGESKAWLTTEEEGKNMETITVVIKRNAPYEQGMYGVSIHNEPGGAGNATPVNSKQELFEQLLAFGLTADYATDLIERGLEQRHDFVTIDNRQIQSSLGKTKTPVAYRKATGRTSFPSPARRQELGLAQVAPLNSPTTSATR
jgi:hypothetical protein